MLSIEPSGGHLGATVLGVDARNPLSAEEFGQILAALGKYSILRFPGQKIEPADQRDFARQFGKVPPIRGRLAQFLEPGVPEVNIISNVVESGRPVGSTDAGTIWHTDMVHNDPPGFANVLYALKVPRCGDKVLGGTEFINLKLAAKDLSDDIKARIKDVVGVYSGEDYLTLEREPVNLFEVKSSYKDSKKPPVKHPILMTHPITGDEVLYLDPGHCDRLEGLPDEECDEMMQFLLKHLMQEKYRFTLEYAENDIALWDNLSMVHRAIFDYAPDEYRYVRRAQVEGDKVFDPAFVKAALARAGASAASD